MSISHPKSKRQKNEDLPILKKYSDTAHHHYIKKLVIHQSGKLSSIELLSQSLVSRVITKSKLTSRKLNDFSITFSNTIIKKAQEIASHQIRTNIEPEKWTKQEHFFA